MIVKLHGDADLLPHEHETLHRKLVDQLIEGGVIKAGEAGRLTVEREEAVAIAPPTAKQDRPARKSVAAGSEMATVFPGIRYAHSRYQQRPRAGY